MDTAHYLYIKLRGLENMGNREVTVLYRVTRQDLFDKVKFEYRYEEREEESHMSCG